MSSSATNLVDLLAASGPVAIIIKQQLRPAEGEGEPIYPPTYPMPTYRGRVHTVRDGEYRVSVELPPFRHDGDKGKSAESKSEDVAGYNIDAFDDGTNVCEVDSPQSQANRLEPLFKTIKDGKLVPQIIIQVGEDRVNLLDAGHRAADAVVRLSSLVDRFHLAFASVKSGNHLLLAKLAPTSLVFGVWDSRGTQVKLPRIIKAEIRATNVKKLTRSAQFNPATDFVGAKAVDESLDVGEGDKNPLGAEGMKHVPAPRTAGGVTVAGKITRTVRVNLVALRELRVLDGTSLRDEKETRKLQEYVLGLVLVAATAELALNLREGCLLVGKGEQTSKLVKRDGTEDDFMLSPANAEVFAENAAKNFYGAEYETKDVRDAMFESGVANAFLDMSTDDRKKVARNGPITAEAIKKLKEKGKDPLKRVTEAIKQAKTELGKKPTGKNAAPVLKPEAFAPVREQLESIRTDELIDQSVKEFVETLLTTIGNDKNSHATCKELDDQIKAFKKQQKEGPADESSEAAEGDA